MKFEINIPYHFDLKPIKEIKRQTMSKVKIRGNILTAVVSTRGIEKEYEKALRTKYKYKKQEFTPFINKIEGVNLKPLTKEFENYEDAVMATALIIKNLLKRSVKADNGFTDFLGSNYLFWNPINSCGAICTLAASILREMGVETELIRGLLFFKKRRKVYKKYNRGEHCWNAIRIPGRGWVEVDFTGSDTFYFPDENYIATIKVKDPTQYFKKHLDFSTTDDYLSSKQVRVLK